MDVEKLSVKQLKEGYRFDSDNNSYICNLCKEIFEIGEIFSFGNRLFEASRAIKMHIQMEHENYFEQLLNTDSKYNSLTNNQKELLSLLYLGLSDKEISERLEISPSTVRHQRFMFREKAKQAKMYLAIYERVVERKSSSEEMIIPVP